MKTPISRRFFFWILALSYFATTSIVLFFVFGYRPDLAQKIFIYTGSITVKANPKTISIAIDGKPPKSKLFNVINDQYYINGLRPHTYNLTVSSDGFKPWKKDVSVHSGISTEFWNVVLLRSDYERTFYTAQNIDQFFPAPEENIFALTRQLGKTHTVAVFDIERDETTNTFLFTKKQFTQNEYENIEWAPNSRELIVPLENFDSHTKDYAIAYTRTNNSYLLSDYIKLPNVHTVRWDPKDRNVIYLLSNKSLFRAELDFENTGNEIILSPIANNVLAYDFTDDGIYLFTTSHEVLYDYDVHGMNFKSLATFDLPKTSSNVRLIAYDNHRLLAIDDTERMLHLYNKGDRNIYTKTLGTNVVGAHFSDDGKKLVFYSPFEIFVYHARDWDAQPIRKEDDMHSIIRFSQLIDNVHFAKDYEHIIYTLGNELKMTELDYRGNRITDTIITLDEAKNTIINKHKMDHIFFIDSTDTTKRTLQSIEFPERETLF